MNDLSFAWRQLGKTPALAAVIVLSLALGIGATTTAICWMRHLVLRPLPGVAGQEQIVAFVSNDGSGCVSLPDLRDFSAHQDVFAGAMVAMPTPVSLTVRESTEWIDAQVVSASYFNVLGVQPILGRTFVPEDDQKPGGNPVLVISERLWRRVFEADPAVIGRTVQLNRQRFTIVGVTPAAFIGSMPPAVQDVWAPSSMIWEVRNQGRYFLTQRSARGWHNLARLQPGVSVTQADSAVVAWNAQLTRAYPDSNRDVTYHVVPLSKCPWGAQTMMAPVLRLLLAVSAGVLLIVAANVANLLLARAVRREREIAIRLSAGASRGQLLRMLLAESALLAVVGGLGGVLAALWMVDSIPLLLDAPRNLHLSFSLDPATLAVTLAVSLTTGLLFGLAPALHATRTDLGEVLKSGSRGSSSSMAHHTLRTWLVVIEVAVAVMLLVSAGLCYAGLQQARRIHPGLNPDHVLITGLQIGMNGYTPETGPAFYARVRERLAALPGIKEAALSSWFPLGLAGCKGSSVSVDGRVRPPGEESKYEFAIVSPRYFAALQIPFVQGRDFAESDRAGARPVAIVNEVFASRFWPNQNPLGREFRVGGQPRTVVGVVKTGKYNRLDEAPGCFYYLPYQQGVPDLDLWICVRTAGDPAAFATAIRAAVRELDPQVELLQTTPLSIYTQNVLIPHRVASILLVLLGGVALALAAMGVYAVIAYSVSERTREFGIRVALGASPAGVVGLVLRQGLSLVLAGVAAGALLALAISRLLRSFLFGVSPLDLGTFAVVTALLVLTGAIACYLPARRATRVNPIEALRAE